MSIELPRFDLTEPQLRWLRLVYERTVVGKYPKIHIERRLHPDWFPPDFDPGGISNVLVGSDGLTLLGVWHVDPDNMLFRRLDAVIHAIKQRIASDPAARVVTASSLAEELDESEPSIVEALGYINHAGARWSSASGASSPGRGYTQITLSNEDDFRAFERYETLEQGVRQHLQDVEAQRQRAILKSRSRQPLIPPAIQHSLENFRRDYRDPARTAFIMMKFGTTLAHEAVVAAIRDVLSEHAIKGLRADDVEYHEDLFPNIQTYMHGCGFGIAILERIEADDFNPNVSLEVGYMFALGKPVCLLKDRTLTELHTDLVGRLYREFDTQRPEETVASPLREWLAAKHLI